MGQVVFKDRPKGSGFIQVTSKKCWIDFHCTLMPYFHLSSNLVPWSQILFYLVGVLHGSGIGLVPAQSLVLHQHYHQFQQKPPEWRKHKINLDHLWKCYSKCHFVNPWYFSSFKRVSGNAKRKAFQTTGWRKYHMGLGYHREWKENISVAAFPNLSALYLCDFPLPEFLAMIKHYTLGQSYSLCQTISSSDAAHALPCPPVALTEGFLLQHCLPPFHLQRQFWNRWNNAAGKHWHIPT